MKKKILLILLMVFVFVILGKEARTEGVQYE